MTHLTNKGLRLDTDISLRATAAFKIAAGVILLGHVAAFADDTPTGYLAPKARPDLVAVLPAPPEPGSAKWRLEMEDFQRTRSLRNSPRWQMAITDANESPSALERDFSCAAGRSLGGPALTRLLSRVAADEDVVVDPAKRHWSRPRPFVGNTAPICVARTAKLASSPDYPSGHATLGWSVALILTEMFPEHATDILERGRQFGESRLVCGVHSESAVAAGRIAGASLVASLHAEPAFRADLAAARQETDAMPAPSEPVCTAERATLHG